MRTYFGPVLLIFFATLFSCMSSANKQANVKKADNDYHCGKVFDSVFNDYVYVDVSAPSNFKFGIDSFNKAILSDINIYENAPLERIVLFMLIDTNGSVTKSYILNKEINEYSNEERQMIINANLLASMWTPATCNSVKVPYRIKWTLRLKNR